MVFIGDGAMRSEKIMWRPTTTSPHASDEVVRRARRRLRACTPPDTFVASQVADV